MCVCYYVLVVVWFLFLFFFLPRLAVVCAFLSKVCVWLLLPFSFIYVSACTCQTIGQMSQPDKVCFVIAYRAFLYDSVEHDHCLSILFPDHEPKVATGVPEGALWTTDTHTQTHIC